MLTYSGSREDSHGVCLLDLDRASPWGWPGCSPGRWENWLMLWHSCSLSALKSRGDGGRACATGGKQVLHRCQKRLRMSRAATGQPASLQSPEKKHEMSPLRRHGRWRRRWKTAIAELQCLKNLIAFCGKMTRFDQGRAVDDIYLAFSRAFSATKAFVSRNAVH